MAPLDIDTALEWRGRTVVDRDGEKIGKLDELYLDESDRPAWGAITTGMFGRRQSFVPLGELQPDGKNLRVPFATEHVKDAPNVEPDAQLSGEDEDRLYRHYGIGGGVGSAGRDAGDAGEDRAGAVTADAEPRADRARADEGDETGRGDRDRGDGAEMIRSEEEVSIGTRRRPTERARLKKYVVTEHVKQVVPVQREEVRVEYEPAGGGEAVTDGETPVRGERVSEDDATAERGAPIRGDASTEGDAPVRDETRAEPDLAAEGGARRARADDARTDDARGGDPGRGLSAGERDRQVVAGGGPEDLAADRAFESEDMSRADRDADRADDGVRDRRDG